MTKAVTHAEDLDYPVASPADIAPPIFRAMLIQQMALQYMRRVPGLSFEEATESAIATWGTDWDSDPEPRDYDDAIDAVESDLEYWEGD
jgi:hypothetical protein